MSDPSTYETRALPSSPEYIKRTQTWRGDYSRCIASMLRDPFAWGLNDCGPGLAGRVIAALTNIDYFTPHVGAYHDLETAHLYLKSLGHPDLLSLVQAVLPEYEHITECRIGDIVVMRKEDSPLGWITGVCNGEKGFVKHPDGMGTLSMPAFDKGFKVG